MEKSTKVNLNNLYLVIKPATSELLTNTGFLVYEDAVEESGRVGGIVSSTTYIQRRFGMAFKFEMDKG